LLMFNRLLVILTLITLTVVYSLYQQNHLESQLAPMGQSSSILRQLPVATFEDLDNELFDLREFYKKDKVGLLVVHFWGTWCGPCEAELPELISLIRRFENRPEVKFLLVAVNDDINKVRKHVKGIVPTQAIWLLDNNNFHRDLFGTTRVPETFVFSSDMVTLRKYVGPQEWNKSLFFQTFDDLLQISNSKL
jgi:cytochrome c biogenesis protein CcmG, thiol:disulfide interchange protein DsbE